MGPVLLSSLNAAGHLELSPKDPQEPHPGPKIMQSGPLSTHRLTACLCFPAYVLPVKVEMEMVIQQYEKAKVIQDEQLERLTQICQEQGVMCDHLLPVPSGMSHGHFPPVPAGLFRL